MNSSSYNLYILSVILLAVFISCGNRKHSYRISEQEFQHIDYTSPVSVKADSLLVLKKERRMFFFSGGNLIKGYTISLGQNPKGHKEYEGDSRTPEGRYTINDKNPNSDYHKNLGISYPNDTDRQHASELGKSPGGDIKIHGFPNGRASFAAYYLETDWTAGCIAVSDEAIDELYEWVPLGTPIIIYP